MSRLDTAILTLLLLRMALRLLSNAHEFVLSARRAVGGDFSMLELGDIDDERSGQALNKK